LLARRFEARRFDPALRLLRLVAALRLVFFLAALRRL